MFESIAYAMGQTSQAQGQEAPGLISFIPMMLIMFGIMYFLVIKPQQKKQKEHEAMISGLKKNDEIVTTGGIHGTLVNVKDKTFIVRIDDNVKIELSKSAVAEVTSRKET